MSRLCKLREQVVNLFDAVLSYKRLVSRENRLSGPLEELFSLSLSLSFLGRHLSTDSGRVDAYKVADCCPFKLSENADGRK